MGQFLPRDATPRLCPSVCLSVSPSVTFRCRDHICWNSSKIISRPNSFRPMSGLTPTWAIWCNRNTPKIGVELGGITQEHKEPAISPKRCKIGPRLLRPTNRKSHTRFRLVPKSITLDDLERRTQSFLSTRYIPGTGKDTDFKFAGTFTGSIRTKAH